MLSVPFPCSGRLAVRFSNSGNILSFTLKYHEWCCCLFVRCYLLTYPLTNLWCLFVSFFAFFLSIHQSGRYWYSIPALISDQPVFLISYNPRILCLVCYFWVFLLSLSVYLLLIKSRFLLFPIGYRLHSIPFLSFFLSFHVARLRTCSTVWATWPTTLCTT